MDIDTMAGMRNDYLTELHLKNHCYVLLRGTWIHPIAYHRFDFSWYPETAMTLIDEYTYRPYVQSIVTESPYLISLYDREQVFVVYEDGSWQHPQYQTYAASMSNILLYLLGIPSEVAAMPLDGGIEFKEVVREYKERIDRAAKLYRITP